ncbi:hypothetical protein BGZ54_007889 [Gamsiella multidivaricata]|nr:hypothetical protein BGZ54_007889 [Gamsiella multidivaricata]
MSCRTSFSTTIGLTTTVVLGIAAAVAGPAKLGPESNVSPVAIARYSPLQEYAKADTGPKFADNDEDEAAGTISASFFILN